MPIFTSRVKWGKYSYVGKKFSTFFHAQYQAQIVDLYYIQILTVDGEAEREFVLQDEHNLRCLLSLGRFYNVHGNHLIYFMLLEFPHLRPCSVWG